MPELCFATNLSSTELATWAQVFVTAAAIIGTGYYAHFQADRQHRATLEGVRHQAAIQAANTAKALLTMASNGQRIAGFVIADMNTRSAVHEAAESQLLALQVQELKAVEALISRSQIPLLPPDLVTPSMLVAATLRQMIWKIEVSLTHYREMDSAQFDDLFATFQAMLASLTKTCTELAQISNRLHAAIIRSERGSEG